MALFSVKPPVVTKQIPASFTIDYAGIAQWNVIPEGYYKDIANWKEVFVRFKHEGSNQKGTIHFKRPGAVANLLLTDAARAGIWKVDSVVIRDYDRGDFSIFANQIPFPTSYDILVQSNATHGDLYIGPGQTVTIPAGSKRQYGDFVIEAGGVLEIGDGGGITEIEVNESCLINGLIKANNGKHLSGTWGKTSVLGEALSYTIVQKQGGKGGKGQDAVGEGGLDPSYFGNWTFEEEDTTIYFDLNPDYTYRFHQIGPADATGQTGVETGTFTIDPVTGAWSNTVTSDTNGEWGFSHDESPLAFFVSNGGMTLDMHEEGEYAMSFQRVGEPVSGGGSQTTPGGAGGLAQDGNGGGGGRAATFGSLKGGDAVLNQAGIGAGQDDAPADAYGEDGAPSLTASEAGSGGFRGAHGQGLYLKARKIQGTGTINAGGQKGGDGGNGGQYDNGGIFYGNGAGGGGAGGSGGKIWLRYKIGTPALNLIVTGGDKGNRGVRPNTEVQEADHGEPGNVGSINLATW